MAEIKICEVFSSVRAVLFDMDGVITDTMPRHCRAWQKAFRDYYNIRVPSIEIYRREGEKSQKSVAEILAKFGIPISKDSLNSFLGYKAGIFTKRSGIKFYSGMKKYLKQLQKTKTMALVTGTQREEIDLLFDNKILGLFSAVVTSSDVTHGKPDPEPYLKALEILDIKAKDALVIENAPYGIASARAASIKVWALPTSLPAVELSNADYVLSGHEELYRLIVSG